MNTFIRLLIVGGAALLLSLFLTPLVREMMHRLGAVDQPSARRINRIPIPRGGGIAIVLTMLTILPMLYLAVPTLLCEAFWNRYLIFAIGVLFLSGVGFIDDLKGLSPLVKLIAQILVALLFCYHGIRCILPESLFGDIGSSPWVYTPLTVIWYIAIINAFNLIDGLDGLASGLAIIAMIGLSGMVLLTETSTLFLYPAVIFIGAVIGFLRYNYNPASVFLGDTGSLFLGLYLATFALWTSHEETLLVGLGVPLLCIGIPLVDTCLAILRRTLRRLRKKREAVARPSDEAHSDKVMTADKDHLHHRILNAVKGNQRHAVWLLYMLAIALVGLGALVVILEECQVSVFLMGFVAFIFVITRAMSNIELWDTGALLSRPETRQGKRSLIIVYYLFADAVSMVALYALFAYLFKITTLDLIEHINLLLAFAVPVFILLVITKSYLRIWGRSTRKDSLTLILAIGIGSLLSHLLIGITFPEISRQTTPFHIFWALVLPLPLLVARLFKSALLQYLAERENAQLCLHSQYDTAIPRILFYGAGWHLRSYITLFETNVTTNHAALIGVLDDNPTLRGRIFRELPVLGPLEVLTDELLATLKPTTLILTSPRIKGEREAEIVAFCKAHNITVKRFSIRETQIT